VLQPWDAKISSNDSKSLQEKFIHNTSFLTFLVRGKGKGRTVSDSKGLPKTTILAGWRIHPYGLDHQMAKRVQKGRDPPPFLVYWKSW
jgi:hypothetical protein